MKTSQQVKVGIFLVVGLAASMFSILILGGNWGVFDRKVYLYSRHDQVQGLSSGSIVSLSGVRVGNIERVDFDKDGKGMILVMAINIDFLNKIPKDSKVEIRTQGALGDKLAFIKPGNPMGPFAKGEDFLESEIDNDILSLIAARGSEAGQVFDVIKEAKILLATLNEQRNLGKILTNMSEASEQLKMMSVEARKAISEISNDNPKKISKIIEKMDSVMTKIDKGEGSLGALINDPSLHEQLKALVGASPRKKYMESVLRNSLQKSEEK